MPRFSVDEYASRGPGQAWPMPELDVSKTYVRGLFAVACDEEKKRCKVINVWVTR